QAWRRRQARSPADLQGSREQRRATRAVLAGVDRPAPRWIVPAPVGRRRRRGVRHVEREPGPGSGEYAPARRTPQGRFPGAVGTRRRHDSDASRATLTRMRLIALSTLRIQAGDNATFSD